MNREQALQEVYSELLGAIWQEKEIYPDISENESYYDDSRFSLTDNCSSDEIASEAENFFSNLDKCWQSPSQVDTSLSAKFGQFVPSDWLQTISQQAQSLVTSHLTPMDKLVKCVEPLFSQWSEDDLQILARPLVSAMRGNYRPQQKPWQELSPVEQVRLTMAIAQSALQEWESLGEQENQS